MDSKLLSEIKSLSLKLNESESSNKEILLKIKELCENFKNVDTHVHINGQPFNVLVVVDNPNFITRLNTLVNGVTNRRITLDYISEYSSVIENICSDHYDAVILDHNLSNFTGIEILYKLKEIGCNTPTIMLTSGDYLDLDYRAMEAGAFDFIHMDNLDSVVLERSLRYVIKNHQTYKLIKESRNNYKHLFEGIVKLIN